MKFTIVHKTMTTLTSYEVWQGKKPQPIVMGVRISGRDQANPDPICSWGSTKTSSEVDYKIQTQFALLEDAEWVLKTLEERGENISTYSILPVDEALKILTPHPDQAKIDAYHRETAWKHRGEDESGYWVGSLE